MEYFILINDQKAGPFTIEELASKNIGSGTMVWTSGYTTWVPARQVSELADLLANLPPEQPLQYPPKTWLVESILVTLFCCLPFGIAGIVNATKVESYFANRQYDQARRYSEQAGTWTKIGFFSSIVLFFLYIGTLGVIALIGALSR